MHRTVQRRTAIAFTALLALLIPSTPAAAKPFADTSILIEGATSAEGIAAGTGTTFYAGDLAEGDIYQGDIRTGTTELLIDAPDGTMAVGMKFDPGSNLLFVAGGAGGNAYVYNTVTLETVAEITLTTLPGSFINDVTLTPQGAWFTNSKYPELYFVPFDGLDDPAAVETLTLTDPELVLADPANQFGFNGIASAKGGTVLLVAHSQNQAIYAVYLDTRTSAVVEGVSVPNVDGILVRGQQLWAVQNFSNQISRIHLSNNFSSGVIEEVITNDDLFQIPTTAALFGNTLAVVNSKFDDLDATEFNVVLVPARL